MKILLVATPSPLSHALTQWFDVRGRACRQVTPDQVPGLAPGDLTGSLVVEIATLTALQAGNTLAVSGEARHHLVGLIETVQCPLLFLSDGRVFDGDEAPLNHRETEKNQPGSVAGGRLSAVEQLLARHVEKHLVLRTGPLFSEQGENFFTALFGRLIAGGEIALNSTLKTCPTHVSDLSRVISALVDQVACGAQNWGAYHYNSSGQTSAYEFTEVMLAFASQHLDLSKAKTTLTILESGVRIDPAVPVLRCEKILHHFGVKQLPWRANLPKPIKQLCEGKKK